jgi:hypothetical protein
VTMRKWGWSKQFGTIGYWIPPWYPRISSFRDFLKVASWSVLSPAYFGCFWTAKCLGFNHASKNHCCSLDNGSWIYYGYNMIDPPWGHGLPSKHSSLWNMACL